MDVTPFFWEKIGIVKRSQTEQANSFIQMLFYIDAERYRMLSVNSGKNGDYCSKWHLIQLRLLGIFQLLYRREHPTIYA